MYYVQYTTYCIEFMRNKLLVFLYSGEEDREGGKGRRKRKEERIGGKEEERGGGKERRKGEEERGGVKGRSKGEEERGGGKGRLNQINSNNVLNKVSLIIYNTKIHIFFFNSPILIPNG